MLVKKGMGKVIFYEFKHKLISIENGTSYHTLCQSNKKEDNLLGYIFNQTRFSGEDK